MLPTLKHCHGISCNTDLSKESFSGEQWKKSHADNTRRCKACILGKVELMKDTIIGAPVCQTIQTKLTGVAGPSSAAPLALTCAPLARSAAPESTPAPISSEHSPTAVLTSSAASSSTAAVSGPVTGATVAAAPMRSRLGSAHARSEDDAIAIDAIRHPIGRAQRVEHGI